MGHQTVVKTQTDLMGLRAKGKVVLKSREPMDKEPDYAILGGYNVTTSKGDIVDFGWFYSQWFATQRADGHYQLVWEMQAFNDEALEINGRCDGTQEINWEEVMAGEINYIDSEIGYHEPETDDYTPIDFECLKFEIELYSDSKLVKTLSFSDEQLKQYQEKVEKEEI